MEIERREKLRQEETRRELEKVKKRRVVSCSGLGPSSPQAIWKGRGRPWRMRVAWALIQARNRRVVGWGLSVPRP